jgi:hypothetical protein
MSIDAAAGVSVVVRDARCYCLGVEVDEGLEHEDSFGYSPRRYSEVSEAGER